MTDKKRLLVTGLSGFTGHYVKQEFTQHGWEVWGLGHHPSNPVSGYYQADLLQPEQLRSVIDTVQPHAVVHLAGIAFAAHRQPSDFYGTHVLGTLNLLDALAHTTTPIEKILLASSANVYGNTVSGIYGESAALKPFNDYGVSKLAMEYMAWLRCDKLPIVITRPFNYTGVGQAEHFLLPKIIHHFQRRAHHIELGNLHVRRDYSDVRNVAEIYRRLIECPKSNGAINVCSGSAFSVDDILDMMAKISGHSMKVSVNPNFVRAGEIDLLVGSHQKLEETIGPVAWIPLHDTLQWMLASGQP